MRGKKAKQLRRAATELYVYNPDHDYRYVLHKNRRTFLLTPKSHRDVYQRLKRKYKSGDSPLRQGFLVFS